MGLNNTVELTKFSTGLITDLNSAEIPITAASRLENFDVRNDRLETLPGVLAALTDLPAGAVVKSVFPCKFTVPSEEDCLLVHATVSSVDKLYIKPYLSLAGAWVDSWQELTEAETGLVADAGSGGDVTDTTHIVDAALLSSADDYYNQWIFFNTTRSASAIIKDYVGSTKRFELAWAIASQTAGDSYFICRNPIYEIGGLCLFDPSSDGCRFLQHSNAVDIVTGSDFVYGDSDVNRKSDVWLGVLNGHEAFDDTDLNFTGFYLSVKPPAALNPQNMISISAQTLGSAETEVPVPTTPSIGYVVLPVAVYDGFQEGPIYKGGSGLSNKPTDGTYYIRGVGFTITGLAAARKIQIDITIQYGDAVNAVALYSPQKGLIADAQLFPIFNRRITHIRFYMAEITDGGNDGIADYGKIASEFRFVEEVEVDNSAWSGTGPTYTQTIYITGDEWDANAGIDISDRQGHASLKVHANANFIASAKKNVAIANAYVDERRQSFVFFSAINSDGQNTPNVIPHTSFLDLSLYGIPKIVGFIEALGFYIAIGENQLVKIDASGLAVDKNIQERGTSSSNAIVNANGLIYFCNLEDIYYYHPVQDVIRSIATGFIREAWRALSTANKQAAAIGYDKRFEMLIVAAGSTIYTYNLPAAYASDLATDTQAIGSWQVYSVSQTFVRFYTDLTGACYGITSAGAVYEMFSSGQANTGIYESPAIQGPLNIEAISMTYNATSSPTLKIFDIAKSETYPVRTLTFRTQSTHKMLTQYKGAKAERFKLRVEAPVGSSISRIEINPQQIDSN